ncbi:hypothetical protein Agub_g12068, partial [Astrephomene gubernaculifera]
MSPPLSHQHPPSCCDWRPRVGRYGARHATSCGAISGPDKRSTRGFRSSSSSSNTGRTTRMLTLTTAPRQGCRTRYVNCRTLAMLRLNRNATAAAAGAGSSSYGGRSGSSGHGRGGRMRELLGGLGDTDAGRDVLHEGGSGLALSRSGYEAGEEEEEEEEEDGEEEGQDGCEEDGEGGEEEDPAGHALRLSVVQVRTLHRVPNFLRPWEEGHETESSASA